ncbi:FlxA-like family protein [Clostridium ljungdahlii]|uniref:Uncharacterized protein n=1 Tax=Clostridium ljungdahlii (strain ATCC 55383 / DSM 13528 / PETC) TaxID=748727 RepID=D8GQF0_CLOLD|nr:FlxA-like family protein [Clostridium ljungdahlii]ADK14073.1 hypothetical protein CLJU_c10050 [Clostridium ljungdahlii DSM 13528]OAA86249.1 hypothetical protein WX45_04272 [Clostridium ljungdahlii DSM 13528]
MISAISSNRSIQTITQNKDNTSEQEVKSLERQKADLEKQLDSIKNGSGDTRTKEQLMKPIQEEIQQIDAEIQQKQVDSVSSKNDHSDGKSNTNTNSSRINTQNSGQYSGENLLLDASKIYKQIETVNSAKNGLISKAKEFNSDADMDEMTHNPRMAEIDRGKAAESKASAVSLESKIGKLNGQMNRDVKNETEKIKDVDSTVEEKRETDDKQSVLKDKNLKEYDKNTGEDSKENKDKSINVFV